MAIIIREYAGYNNFNATRNAIDVNFTEGFFNETNDSFATIEPDSLMVDVEGIHAYPYATRNFTRYMPKCLKNSIPSWTKPYRKPVIKHHNEENGETIGRIINAKYKESNTLSNTPALVFTINIPNGQAKKEIKNGLLATTSIGVIAHDVRCSICGAHLEDGSSCGHERGQEYSINGKKEICYWDMYSIEAKELSYVIVPSDAYSKNIRAYPATSTHNNNKPISESLNDNEINIKGETNLEDTKVLKEKLQQSEESITKLNEKITELESEKKSLKEKIVELNNNIDSLKEEKTQEIQLREGAESELIETKKELRLNIIENFQYLRQATGKEKINLDLLENRTDDSLKDSIKDLKEELSIVNNKAKEMNDNLPKPGSVKSPIKHSTNVQESHKESKNKKEINFDESLEQILTAMFNKKR